MYTKLEGTVNMTYAAPEIMDPNYDDGYEESVDIYSLSLIMFELFTGKYPFKPCSNDAKLVKEKGKPFVPEYSQDIPAGSVWNCIQNGYSIHASERPSLKQFKVALEQVPN
jgi:serine/threonine protein kinase